MDGLTRECVAVV